MKNFLRKQWSTAVSLAANATNANANGAEATNAEEKRQTSEASLLLANLSKDVQKELRKYGISTELLEFVIELVSIDCCDSNFFLLFFLFDKFFLLLDFNIIFVFFFFVFLLKKEKNCFD